MKSAVIPSISGMIDPMNKANGSRNGMIANKKKVQFQNEMEQKARFNQLT